MNTELIEDLLEVFNGMRDLLARIRYQNWPPKMPNASEFDELLFETTRVHRRVKIFINKVKKEESHKKLVEVELNELEKRLKGFLNDNT